ncbi:MAG: hypothetical protein JXR91_12515 [Deltaproteobacteria bacterium]|nr:hypothetical protein [Deltaproteobacteria bacterium]
MEKIYFQIFSDASFSNELKTGVGGFVIIASNKGAKVFGDDDFAVHTFSFTEQNNIRCEFRALFEGLAQLKSTLADKLNLSNNTISEHVELTIFTDCRTISDLPRRRERLEANNFLSKKTKTQLANADLYIEFFKLYDQFLPTIHWIKGHIPKNERTYINKIFSTVDQATRKKLTLMYSKKA